MLSSVKRFDVVRVLLIVGLALAASRTAVACNNDLVPPCDPRDCTCKVGVSANPIRYFNGEINMAVDDLDCAACGGAGAASGSSLGHRRWYSNREIGDRDAGNGCRWLVQQWPYLVREGDSTIMVKFEPMKAYWFDESQGTYTARYGAKQTLVHDTNTHFYYMTDPDGTVWEFYDFDAYWSSYPKGLFNKCTKPNGEVIEVAQQDATRIKEIQRTVLVDSTPTLVESLLYHYPGTAPDTARVDYVTLRKNTSGSVPSWKEVRQVHYTYYHTSPFEPCGLTGDLKTATRQRWDGSNWVDTDDVYYYRYYTGAEGGIGFAHGLKFAFLPAAYQKLKVALGHTPSSTDTDPAVEGYACYHFKYNADHRVTNEVVFGQSRETNFTYTDSTNTDGYNNWKRQTVETRCDPVTHGTYCTNTVYTNFLGQVIASILTKDTDEWVEYNHYNSGARVDLHAHPSAVASCTHNTTTLSVVLEATAGLIETYSYDGNGNKTADYVKHGEDDETPTLVREYGYTAHTINSGESTQSTTHPLTSLKVYPGGEYESSSIETQYTYNGYYPDGHQVKELITTLPIVSDTRNGPGGSTYLTRKEWFGENGRVTWSMDERGRVTYHAYDAATGALTQTIEDADAEDLETAEIDLPDGCDWTIPNDGLNLATDYEHDDFGRVVQVLGPPHDIENTTIRTAAWTVYDDENHEVRSAQGYATGSIGSYMYHPVNPVSISKYDADGRLLESIQATWSGTQSGFLAAGHDDFAQSTYVRWTVNQYSKTLLAKTAVYFHVPSGSSVSDGFVGTKDTDYNVTEFAYDLLGRRNRIESPGGTITRTVLDARGLVVSAWIGTDDVPTSGEWSPTNNADANMVEVTGYQYDGDAGKDGYLTRVTQHVDETPANDRVSKFQYDWRDRREYSIDNADADDKVMYAKNYYDNLNRVTKVERYFDADEDLNFPSDGTVDSGDTLLARNITSYDEMGRVYQTAVYAVNSSGTATTALTNNVWYDPAGNVVKQKPAGAETFTKTLYDGANRPTKRYVGYDSGETEYTDIVDSSTGLVKIDDDKIFEQTETDYDDAGNAIFVTSRSRLHNATGPGALTTPGGTDPKARVSYAAAWYDGIGREVATANYGTNGGSPVTRPATVPDWDAGDELVTKIEYVWTDVDSDGIAEFVTKVTDPANKQSWSIADHAGRVVKTIQNYENGTVESNEPDKDVTIVTAYTADGQVSTITAKAANSNDDQTTQYIYGIATGGFTPKIYRNDLLRAVIYPDSDDPADLSDDGEDDLYDRVEYEYNRQGQVTKLTDQNETVHDYVYDGLGRQTADAATVASGNPQNIDEAVLRIERSYEVRGMVEHVTSYDAATSGNPVNDVLREYGDIGRLTKEYQEHNGAKDGSTLYVEYGYESIATALRPTSIRYPNTRHVYFDYSGTHDGYLNRLTKILDNDDSTVLSQYEYLGLGTIVMEKFNGPNVTLDYYGGTSGAYAGFDDFGRVKQQWWHYDTSTNREKFSYGYDRASNRTYREHGMKTLKDEHYTYDDVNQLTVSKRGTLNGGKTDISDTPKREEDFTLDATGNWSGYVQKTDGNTDLDQSRSHNHANEIDLDDVHGDSDDCITASGGTLNWADPVHDAVGNMTTVPKPSSLANGLSLKYDAWNRLVQVTDGSTVVAKYEYDGDHRRIKKHIDSDSPATPGDPDGIDRYEHLFYSGVQLVETRNTTTESAEPESLNPKYQFVWSPRYIDAPILRDENKDNDTVCTDESDERLYYLTDANQNVTSLVDTSGTAQERYIYDPYGRVTVYDETWSNTRLTTAYDNYVLFTGRYSDSETGLYYYRARYYHPDLGRFISRDPKEYGAGDFNLYRYCGNNPIIRVDPQGTKFVVDIRVDTAGRPQSFNLQATQKQLQALMDKAGVNVSIIVASGQHKADDLGWQYVTHCYWSGAGFWTSINPTAWVIFSAHDLVTVCCRSTVGYNHNVHFNVGLRPVAGSAIAQTGGRSTVIWPDHATHQLESKNLTATATMWANILAHEVLYLGALGRSDSEATALSRGEASTSTPVPISDEEAAALNKRFPN